VIIMSVVMSVVDYPTLPVPFLLKPISPKMLIETVEHFLSEPADAIRP
jgi:hypothetical protein